MMADIQPIFFATQAELRKWVQKNHKKLTEVYIGYYKTSTGKPSITWPQSVDEALCVGWIDGVRKSLGDESYMIRFTPRKKTSIWSAVNIKRIGELIEQRLVNDEGKAAFENRNENKSRVYSFEQDIVEFDSKQLAIFKKNKKAWAFFNTQPPSYRRPATWLVISAKQETTREKRLAQLIADSEAGLRIKELRRPAKAKK